MLNTQNNKLPEFGAKQSRDYISYREFIRCSYVNVYSKMTERAYLSYFADRDAQAFANRFWTQLTMSDRPVYQIDSRMIKKYLDE